MLLEAKLHAPQVPTGMVSRRPLTEQARSSPCRIVGVTAPAGYGKSTFLAQWAQAEERAVAWVSLDRLDNDPTVLLGLLSTAFTRAMESDAGDLADIAGGTPSVLGRGATHLASVLSDSPRPFVLFVDDLHELRSPVAHDAISVVAAAIPTGSQLVTASRHAQPHLPRMLAAHDALELTRSDLALDPEGARHVFEEAGVDLTGDEVASLVDRTEGWPVGLYLAALIARDDPRQVAAVSGEDRYISDYLYRETFSQLDERVREMLRRTAVLDQLSGPLCDALLDRHDSQARLRELEASTQFVFAVDRTRQWYRCHSLFREFLLGELERVEPELRRELHIRAAAWYEAHESPELTVEHLLQTDERRHAAELVARVALPTFRTGQLATIRRWFTALGDEELEAYPPLATLRAWFAASTGSTEEAMRWLEFVDSVEFDGTPADGSASFDSARAMLRVAMCPGGAEQAMADAALALEQEPAWGGWRSQAVYLAGEAHALAGDADASAALFEEASAVAQAVSNGAVIALSESHLAWSAMDRGHWEEAAQHVKAALATLDEHRIRESAASVLTYGAAARLDLHRGDRSSADRRHRQAMRDRAVCTHALPFLSVRGRLQLAEVSWAAGDPETTRHLLREIDDILRHRPSLGALVNEVETLRSTVTSATGPSRAFTGRAPLTPAELRLLPYLQTHLTVAEIGERLFISRNTASTEIAAIYRKLGVSSRAAAVEQAIAVGLLGE
jgi:LuxR family maltose regulon positive regulatory protein